MKNGSDMSFYVKFLGGFSLCYGDRKISIDISLQTKYMQILMRLLKAGAEGVDRKDLMDAIWPEEEDLKKRMNNFRAQRFLLRKMIDRLAFPKGTYILRRKDRYYFSFEYQVETDTGYLDRLVSKLQAEDLEEAECQKLLRQFYQNYPGRFLPALDMEMWVIQEELYYHNWYYKCASALYSVLQKQRNLEKMLELSTNAGRIYPYDEWQMKQIDCLMALDREPEAAAVYEQALRIYHENFGTAILEEAMKKYRGTSGRFFCTANTLAGIQEELRESEEEWEAGAYYCPYPSFLDICHLTARLREWSGMNYDLIVCTLREKMDNMDGTGAAERLADGMKQLLQVMMSLLQKDSIVTRYSLNQFLVLVPGMSQKEYKVIVEQIRSAWNREELERDMAVIIELMEMEGCRESSDFGEESRAVCDTY